MDPALSIPGLGQALPSKSLPTSNFVSDSSGATAGLDKRIDTEMADASDGQRDISHGIVEPNVEPNEQTIQNQDAIMEGTEPQCLDVTEAQQSNEVVNEEGSKDEKMKNGNSLENATASSAVRGESEARAAQTNSSAADGEVQGTDAVQKSPPASPRVTDALEAALDGLLGAAPNGPAPESEAQNGQQSLVEPKQKDRVEQNGTAPGQGEADAHPEWEVDSSPYASSSSSSSDDSSDDEDDSDVDQSKLLGVEETARLLMEAEGGSDDEMDGARAAKQAAGVRTKNEIPDEPEPKPAIILAPDETIAPLGIVQHVVEGTQAVIEALRDGTAVTILDRGTVLCKEDRSVLGVIHDTIATVHKPMYVLKFRSEEEAKQAGLERGMQVWYPKQRAMFVFPSQLRQEKGSDASNLHDEEVGPDEVEYSDDEQEQAHKREKKNRKRAKGKPKWGDDNESRAPPNGGGSNFKHEEGEDGLYNKLPRPSNFGMGLPPPPPTAASAFLNTNGDRGGHTHGRRGDFRGRGGRGRGFNGRGRGGGSGHNNHNHHQSNHTLPPHPQSNHQPPPPAFATNPPPAPGQWPFPVPPMPQFGGAAPPAPPTTTNPSYPIPNWSASQPNPFPFPPVPMPNWSNTAQRPPQQASYTTPAGGYNMPPQYPPGNVSSTSPPAPNYQYPNYYGGQVQNNQQQRWG